MVACPPNVPCLQVTRNFPIPAAIYQIDIEARPHGATAAHSEVDVFFETIEVVGHHERPLTGLEIREEAQLAGSSLWTNHGGRLPLKKPLVLERFENVVINFGLGPGDDGQPIEIVIRYHYVPLLSRLSSIHPRMVKVVEASPNATTYTFAFPSMVLSQPLQWQAIQAYSPYSPISVIKQVTAAVGGGLPAVLDDHRWLPTETMGVEFQVTVQDNTNGTVVLFAN